MATTCTFKDYAPNPRNGITSEISGTVDLADVVVRTTTNDTGGWATATVTADKQQRLFLSAADALTAGVSSGWYEKEGGTTYRKALQ